jgi:probable rRNA maturation factor
MRSIYLSPWRIDVDRRDGVARLISDAELVRVAARALDAAGAPWPASLAVTLADDEALAALNATHMGVSGPTDVLSFPILPPSAFPAHAGTGAGSVPMSNGAAGGPAFPLPPGARQPLGDVIVSVERAIEQAERGRGGQTGDVRWSAADELRLLVTHGTLHVCGWDHAEPAEEAAMRGLEQRLLAVR